MRTRDDLRTHSFGNPRAIDEVSDLGRDAYQIARLNTESLAVGGVPPERVTVRDLGEPFRLAGSGMNERRQAKCRHEHHFVIGECIDVDVTFYIGWKRIFRPSPIDGRLGEQLLFLR